MHDANKKLLKISQRDFVSDSVMMWFQRMELMMLLAWGKLALS